MTRPKRKSRRETSSPSSSSSLSFSEKMAIDTGGGHEDNRSSSSSSSKENKNKNNNKNDNDKGDDGNSEIGRRRSDHHKIMMILSPAKTLDLTPLSTAATTAIVLAKATQPNSCNHPEKTRAIARAMKQKTPSELMKLLGISKTIGTTAFEYWKDFQVHDNKSDVKTANKKENDDEEEGGGGKPCVFCFSGIAYQGLQSSTCSAEELQWLQKSLRIVDPLYGVLRPLDIMQPYRLEMATKGLCLLDDDDNHNKHGTTTTKKTKKAIQQPIKLAEYWKVAVTKHLLEELTSPQHGESFEDQEGTEQTSQSPNTTTDGRGGGGGILVNLASDEYSAAVDVLQFSTGSKKNKKKNNKSKDEEEEEKDSHGQTVHLVKVIFWEQGRVVTVHAKRARGLMARYIAHVQATTLDQIRNFQEEGYRFVASKSDEYTLVFDRNKDWKTKKKPSTVSSSSSNTTVKTQKRSASQALSESTSTTKTGTRRTRKSKSFKA